VLNILKKYIQGRTLDVGSWDGQVARSLSDNIVGIDVVLHPQPFIPVTLFDGKHIPYDDKEFDTVLCCTALHHAEDQDAVLAEMKRVGKRLVIMEDRFDNVIDRVSVLILHDLIKLVVEMPYQSQGFRSISSWRDLFKRHGLQLVSCDTYPGIQPLWVGLRHYVFVLEPQ